LSGVSTIIEW